MKFPKQLQKKIDKRHANHTFRELQKENCLVDFSSNDYLGFAKNKTIANKVSDALVNKRSINGSTGSRLISGNNALFEELELMFANLFLAPAALIFNSGFDANIGLFSTILQRGDIILYDELCHASIRDGIKLSNARSLKFKHNDLRDLEKKFKNVIQSTGNTYVVVESIYSMDGDHSPLKEISDYCRKNHIYFIVDEAHATGVYGNKGNGLVVKLDLEKYVFARIYTFGKAIGCQGAVIVGSQELRSFLINYARSFIYTTAMSMHNLFTLKYAFEELKITKEIKKLNKNISFFKEELKTRNLEGIFLPSTSAIQCCIIPNSKNVSAIAVRINTNNFSVKAILSPTVPSGKERLRFCIHSYNSDEQIQKVLNLLSTFV
jgi:8-amino-7-oxononanoate synthase